LGHPQFSFKTPNKVRALVSAFCHSNLAAFHAEDGSGYTFWADMVIKLDPINPQVAARLARAMERWQRFTPKRQLLMLEALKRVNNQELLSPDVSEVVQKALGVV
jgi:aminopeptidase N